MAVLPPVNSPHQVSHRVVSFGKVAAMLKPVTPEQISQFHRLISASGEAALRQINIDESTMEQLLHECSEPLIADIVDCLRRYASGLPRHHLAREILGNDFISADDHLPTVRYTNGEIMDLERALPDKKTLLELRDEGMILVACPPEALRLRDIYELRPDEFDRDYDNSAFEHQDAVQPCGWIAMRKSLIPASADMSWKEQDEVFGSGEALPNAAEIAWCMLAYYLNRDMRLFEEEYVRTTSKDVADDGQHVSITIGGFTDEGIQADFEPLADALENVGIVKARRFLCRD